MIIFHLMIFLLDQNHVMTHLTVMSLIGHALAMDVEYNEDVHDNAIESTHARGEKIDLSHEMIHSKTIASLGGAI